MKLIVKIQAKELYKEKEKILKIIQYWNCKNFNE